jgi:hypothetical protein
VIEQAYLDTEMLSFAAKRLMTREMNFEKPSNIYEEQFALLWTL